MLEKVVDLAVCKFMVTARLLKVKMVYVLGADSRCCCMVSGMFCLLRRFIQRHQDRINVQLFIRVLARKTEELLCDVRGGTLH